MSPTKHFNDVERVSLLFYVATTKDLVERTELANRIVTTVQIHEGTGDATFTSAVLEQAENPAPDPEKLLAGVLFEGVDAQDPDVHNTVIAKAESVLR